MKKFIKRNFLLVTCVLYWIMFFLAKLLATKTMGVNTGFFALLKIFNIFFKLRLPMLIVTALVVALFIKKKFFKRAVKEAIEDTQGAGKKDENETACAVVQPQNESASALSYRAEDLRDSDVF